ncbi:LutC/YkgG family protein [Deminuibacter soli]|uniref:Lactate utilization protein B/C n=1 Tax=Deminuibacter soli TaxID=2291815 RepID=A0A3E1NRL2_9BACT|nr:LUD domain-containing protein [Deminuibacter soli]RFM30581.1 lactate utilization protein B/C [Deminuibacter soli]
MSSRNKILSAIRSNKPGAQPLPGITGFTAQQPDTERFVNTLQSIGGRVVRVRSFEEIIAHIREAFPEGTRIISSLPQLAGIAETGWSNAPAHSLENVQLAVFKAQLGVCENGAVWVTEQDIVQRAAAFIAEHLAMVLEESTLVATMHDAYLQLHNQRYGYGVFIAGPSKTADIEQSLVLGAHGPRTMTLFLV